MRDEAYIMLREDYFKNKKIKKLRSMKHGDAYNLAYMYLFMEASEWGGLLLFEEAMNNLAKQLDVPLDENDNGERITAQQAIDALLSADLIELSTDGRVLRFKKLEVLNYGRA